jgi:lysophospholipase L1-like esterase
MNLLFARNDRRTRPRSRRQAQPTPEALEDRRLLFFVGGWHPGLDWKYAPPSVKEQYLTIVGLSAGFNWSQEQRYGIDENGDGRIDLRTDAAYVQDTTAYQITFKPDPSLTWTPAPNLPTLGYQSALVTHSWMVDGSVLSTEVSPVLELTTGPHIVTQTITFKGQSKSSTQSIEVGQDRLIVAIGDSVASGEGNPEVPQTFSDFLGLFKHVDQPAQWGDNPDAAAAHRSSFGFPAQVAGMLEQEDPHSSVTFVDLAASGARLGDVVNQLDELQQILTPIDGRPPRQIDALIVSVGANDINFREIATGLAEGYSELRSFLFPAGLNTSGVLDRSWLSTMTLSTLNEFLWGKPTSLDFADLQSTLLQLNTNLHAKVIAPSNVYITEYYDPTSSGPGGREALGDLAPDLGIGISEADAAWARANLIDPLNASIWNAAHKFGWTYVGGIRAAFDGHGYGATYNRWIITASESRIIQGPYSSTTLESAGDAFLDITGGPEVLAELVRASDKAKTRGTLHPNKMGQYEIALIVLDHLHLPDFAPSKTFPKFSAGGTIVATS